MNGRVSVLLGKPPSEQLEAAAQCHRAPEPRVPIPIGDGASLLRRRPDVAEQALTTYASEQQHYQRLSAAEQRAHSAFSLAQLLYRAGSIAQLDLIVTQNELLDARLARIQSEQQLASERLQLFRALGGGWGQDGS